MIKKLFLSVLISSLFTACASKQQKETARIPAQYKAQNVNGVWLGPNAQVSPGTNPDGVLRGGIQEQPQIFKEAFADNSWGLLYSFRGKLYVQRSKVCTLNDSRTAKCPTSARCLVSKANDITLCRADVLPKEVETHFDQMNEGLSTPDNVLQFIWSN